MKTKAKTTHTPLKPSTPLIPILLVCISILFVITIILWQHSLTKTSQLTEQLNSQHETITVLQDKVGELLQSKEKNTPKLALIKSYYALQTAKFQLNTEKNVDKALQILKNIVSGLPNTPESINTRMALTEDINTLENVPHIDIDKAIAQIETLNSDLMSLKNKPQILPKDQPPTVTDNSDETSFWYRLWHNSKTMVAKAVIIRRNDADLVVLTPEQEINAILNMQNSLKLAESALVQKNALLYQNNLKEVVTSLNHYFIRANPSQTAKILTTIQELQKINLNFNLPSLDRSDLAIQTAIMQ